jgi:hypothetical protein
MKILLKLIIASGRLVRPLFLIATQTSTEMCIGSGVTSNKMGGHFSSFHATGVGSFGDAAWCFANIFANELFALNVIAINEKGKIIAQKKLPSNAEIADFLYGKICVMLNIILCAFSNSAFKLFILYFNIKYL